MRSRPARGWCARCLLLLLGTSGRAYPPRPRMSASLGHPSSAGLPRNVEGRAFPPAPRELQDDVLPSGGRCVSSAVGGRGGRLRGRAGLVGERDLDLALALAAGRVEQRLLALADLLDRRADLRDARVQ